MSAFEQPGAYHSGTTIIYPYSFLEHHTYIYVYIFMYGVVYFVSVKALCLASDTAVGVCTADYLRCEKSGDLKRERGQGNCV